MKTINTLLTGLLIVPFLVGCGGDSNALKDYKDIKGEAPTNEKPVTQMTAKDQLGAYFYLQVVGTNAATFANINQGEESEILLKVSVNRSEIKNYEVKLLPFPMADGPVLSKTDQPDVYSLKWNPPVGVVSKGDSVQQFQVQIMVAAAAPTAGDLSKMANTFDFDLIVNSNTNNPTIVDKSKLDVIQEGVVTKFSVVIDDPASTLNDVSKPKLIISPYISANTEAYRADGAPYIFQESVEKLNKTQWKVNATIYADRLPLDRDRRGTPIPSAASVPVCFFMQAQSGVSGKQSGEVEVCATGQYAAQPPAMSFVEGSGPAEIKAGVQSTFTVKLSTPNAQSKITLKNPAKQIANLSGTKSVDCAYDNGNQMNALTCTVKWTPTCVKTATKSTLTITADSTLNDKVKSSAVSKDITVSPNPEACTGGH